MSNDITSWLAKLNLPELVAGPAGKAISRLIAGLVEIPAAHLDSFAQSVKDKTAAKSVVSKAVADAAAKLAAGDNLVVQRAAHSLLAKELRHQENKEAIAARTVELLRDESVDHSSSGEPSSDVDEDWLNVFERYAENASSERLREMWARVLAGQIRKPKSFSLRTLRFISELDSEIASLFERYAPAVLSVPGRTEDPIIPYPVKEGQGFTDMLKLEDAGLVSYSGGNLWRGYGSESAGHLILAFKYTAIAVHTTQGIDVKIGCALLTKTGQEIYSILSPGDSLEFARKLTNQFPKENVTRIDYMQFIQPRTPQGDLMFLHNLWTAQSKQNG